MLSNTVANLRNEHVKAITLRSGKELAELEQPEKVPSNEVEAPKGQKYKILMRWGSGEKSEKKTLVSATPLAYDPSIPYPQTVRQQKKE